jgi:hypothetical protein
MAEAAVEEVAEEGAGEKKPRNPIVLIIVGVVGLLVIGQHSGRHAFHHWVF